MLGAAGGKIAPDLTPSECAVPILDKKTWQKARDAFEARMKSAGKSFGPAPEPGGAKPESSESEQS